MDKPLVSIIIPTYNNLEYVRDAIDSAINQTYANIEIIVVDDGSTDGTKGGLDEYIKSDAIRYIYQENKGLSGARNTGINAAKGEYVALLDADDLFKPTKIEKQLTHLMHHANCDFCYCDVILFHDERPDKLFRYNYKYHSGSILKYLLHRNFINPSTLLFNKKNVIDKFGLFDESLRRAEDIEYYLRVSLVGAKFCFLDEPLFMSRMRKSGSLQSSQTFVQKTTLSILENTGKKLTPAEREAYGLDKVIDSRKIKLSLAYLADGNRQLGRKMIREVKRGRISKISILVLSFMPVQLVGALVYALTALRRRILFKRSVRI